MLYRVLIPKQAVGANKVFFDLFVPGASLLRAELLSLTPVVSGAVAVTGVVGVDLILTRTTTAGTGGTASTYEGTSTTAMTISATDGSPTLTTAGMTGTLAPTGGATAGAAISWGCLMTEETNAATYLSALDLARNPSGDLPGIMIEPGTGIRVVQGAVASVGNIGFNAVLNLKAK